MSVLGHHLAGGGPVLDDHHVGLGCDVTQTLLGLVEVVDRGESIVEVDP